MEGTIGEIRLFAGNFAPQNWAFCDGQLLAISQNTALFSILGTTYGGDGRTTFALPDLRGRVPVGPRTGPGLPSVGLGEQGGTPSVTLTVNEMAAHGHTFAPPANSGAADDPSPVGNVPATEASGTTATYSTQPTNAAMRAGESGISGGSQPHTNMQPYLGLNYIICLYGIYPPRS